MTIKDIFPLAGRLSKYQWSDFRFDLSAGMTVSVLAIPQVMAYAQLAGLPPVYGLYAAITPLIVYALFGTSPQLSVGPTAVVSLLVLSGLGSVAGVELGSAEFIALTIATAFLAGVVQLLLGVFRLGMLANLLSRPVISGFTSAAAVLIFLSQLKYLLGVPAPRSSGAVGMVTGLFPYLGQINWPTLALGLVSLAALIMLKRWRPRWPGALIVLVVATLSVYFFDLSTLGISVVGDIPKGLPSFDFPLSGDLQLGVLLPAALTIGLISFIESLAISKTMEGRHGTYRIDANKELIALGLSKVVSACFQAFPTTGSFSRSAMNDYAGARTGVSSIVSAIVLALVLMYLTPAMYFLPQAVLAAVITMAVYGLIEFQHALHLWRLDRRDWLALITTFLMTLILGVQAGVVIGVTLSVIQMIYHNARPHMAVLGRLPNSNYFRNIDRFGKAEQEEGVLILRFDAQLYFGNAEYFRESVEALIKRSGDSLKLLILDAASIHDIDSTGIHEFKRLLLELDKYQIKFYLAGVIGPVRDSLSRNGLTQEIGPKCHFLDVAAALDYYHSNPDEDKGWSSHALQSNK